MIHSDEQCPNLMPRRRRLRLFTRVRAETVLRAKEAVPRAREAVSRAKEPVAPRRPRALRSREVLSREVLTKVLSREVLTKALAAPRPLRTKEREDRLLKEDLLKEKERAVAMFAMSEDFDRTACSPMNA